MKRANILSWLSNPKNLWGTIFIYTILAGLFTQLILLPYIVPSWHSGNGLLNGMDGQKFHRIALELSIDIEERGWRQWEPAPRGQLVSGVAAVMYVLIYPAPWSVLPINAFLNASACVCMYLILSRIIKDPRKAFIASLPFIFFPSNLLWNTQFHNENYAIPGVIFILYGWILITKKTEDKKSISASMAIQAVASIAIGSLLLGLARAYILSGMYYLSIVVALALSIYWVFEKNKIQEKVAKLGLVVFFCAVMALNVSITESKRPSPFDLSTSRNTTNDTEGNPSKKWSSSNWLPSRIDRQLKGLAQYRNKFIKAWAHGGSSVDLDVAFGKAGDMIAYIPRSIQIAFLSPFPSIWFNEGKKEAGSAMRIVSAFEMLFVYFCLLGLPIFLWHHRKHPPVWIILFVCTSMLIIYAMLIPNLGSLYRFRYPYLMPLVCFGLAGWLVSTFKNPFVFFNKKNS
jgi:hypothetical protein